jgi:hypothetical protein
MWTDATTTEIFARIYGLYFLAAGVGLLVDRAQYATAVAEFRQSVALSYLGGIAAFIVGAVTITFHNDWSNWAAIVITLVAWVSLIEGVLYIAARRVMVDLIGRIPLGSPVMIAIGVVVAVIGVALLWVGFSAPPTT